MGAQNQIFKYNGNPITFQLGNGTTMVNATQMAKPFYKRVAEWLRLPSSKEFINVLGATREYGRLDAVPMGFSHRLVETINGVGTWMHEDVALEFARWLSPHFAIWCNDRIKELMRHGITATPQTIENMLSDPDNMIKILTALKDERKKVKTMELQLKTTRSEQKRLIGLQLEQYPKVKYYDEVMQSKSTYTTTQIAKQLGMSAITLNEKLHKAHVQFKQIGQWLLYAEYQNSGFVKSRTFTKTTNTGEVISNTTTVWTETGKAFIHELIKQSK